MVNRINDTEGTNLNHSLILTFVASAIVVVIAAPVKTPQLRLIKVLEYLNYEIDDLIMSITALIPTNLASLASFLLIQIYCNYSFYFS